MDTINRDAYLAHALELTREEQARRDALMDWLPSQIIDVHTHANLGEHVRWIDERSRGHMLSTFPHFTIAESDTMTEIFFPGIHVRRLRFAKTFKGIDHKAANVYLLDHAHTDDQVALYGLPDDIDYTVKQLQTGAYAALKMYYSYLSPPATRIYEYFRPEILEEAQRLGIPIILHLPCIITRCEDDLAQLVKDFPHLRIVLAHLGLTKLVVPGLEQAYARFAQHDNIALDTSMVPTKDVVALAVRHFGPTRVLYGSDEPLYLIRARAYTHPERGQRLITQFPYHWVDQQEHRTYRHLAQGVQHALWGCLEAIRGAIEQAPHDQQEDMKQRIFHDNAVDWYQF